MNQYINILINLLGYSDPAATTNPLLRDIDYKRQFIGVPTQNSFSQRITIPAASSMTVASTARSLSQDATSQYKIDLYENNTFRFSWAGGTNPILKTKRAVTYSNTTAFTLTKVGNIITYTWTGVGTDPNFAANGVIAGDIFHIEEGGNFNTANSGSFVIVGVADGYVEVINEDGVEETAIALGAVVDGLWSPLQIFKNDGVQVGDNVSITSTAFNVNNRGIYTITNITPEWFELENGLPGVPEGPFAIGAAPAIVFYSDIFKFLYLESDQTVSVRINGDTSDRVQIEPIEAADPTNVGIYLQRGGVWSLVIANNSNTTANVKVALCE
jgi:hypothetical protein